MKRILTALSLLVFLAGCAGEDEMQDALELRSRLIASDCEFRCQITADYIDSVEQFTLDCTASREGEVAFTVTAPQSISGITGTVSGEEGTLTFDGQVLAFPLLAQDRLSPVSAPWLLMNTLRGGCITACAEEGEGLHLTIDDSYADDALTVEIWTDEEERPTAAQISWQGRRVVSMRLEEFVYL